MSRKWLLAATAALSVWPLLSIILSAPAIVDADQDGIPDDWEHNGSVSVTLPNGQPQTVALTGASSIHKDIIVWVDWMGDEVLTDNNGTTTHNHRPDQVAIDTVKKAFKDAKQFTKNPDNTTGVNLIVLVSDTPVQHVHRLGNGAVDNSVWAQFDSIRDAHFPAKLKGIAHYCLFAHDIDNQGSSGVSRGFGAYDFIVSLGQWQEHTGNETEQAGTFMHELGHNLGLHHGGMDDLNFKPNYLSVMNYFFQTDGLLAPQSAQTVNYSTFQFPHMQEGDLDENMPLSTDANWADWDTRYFCPDDKQISRIFKAFYGHKEDWNCNGEVESHAVADLNGDDPSQGHAVDDLKSQVDWTQINFVYPQAGGPAGHPELTVSDANKIPLPAPRGIRPSPNANSVKLSWEPLFSKRVRGYEIKRIIANEPTRVFSTVDTSFVDNLGRKVPNVRYEVSTLYLPHGASGLIKLIGRKEQEEVWGMGSIGTIQKPVSLLIASGLALRQLQSALSSEITTMAAEVNTKGASKREAARLKQAIQELRSLPNLLLASQPASVEVKLP